MKKVKPIKMVKFKLVLWAPKKEVDSYGGRENYEALLYDIIERYGNSEYFDAEHLDEVIEKQSEA